MMDYSEFPCDYCGEHTVIYHQYVADARCESCGKWEIEDRETADELSETLSCEHTGKRIESAYGECE